MSHTRGLVISALIGFACAASPDARTSVAQDAMTIVFDAPATINNVWPGFMLLNRSFVVYDSSGAYLHTPGDPPEGFRKEGRWFYRPGRIPGLNGGIAIDHAVGALRVTAVPVSTTADRTAQTLYHEAFHAFQREHFPPLPAIDAQSLGLTPAQAAAIEVERRVLAEALALRTPHARLAEALALRRERAAAAGQALESAERGIERHEGIAEYVGYVSIALALKRSRITPRQQIARALLIPLKTMGGSPDERLVRTRSYATGAAFGILLDRLMPEWKNRALASALDELAAEAIRLNAADVPALASAARGRHGYDKLLALTDPPWGSLVVLTDAAFLALASYRVVVDLGSQAQQSFSLSGGSDPRLGMHRPVAGLLLLPSPARYQLTDEGLSVLVEKRPVRVARPPFTQTSTVTILLPGPPDLNGRNLPAAGTHDVGALDLEARGLRIQSKSPTRVEVVSAVELRIIPQGRIGDADNMSPGVRDPWPRRR